MQEERSRILEHSAAAMADELLKKTALIQYYCMEGGKKSSTSSTPASTPTSESSKSLTMKKMVNLLMHPDQETRKEVLRMQNLLEETLTKNMHLQNDLEALSQEVVRLSKAAVVVVKDGEGK